MEEREFEEKLRVLVRREFFPDLEGGERWGEWGSLESFLAGSVCRENAELSASIGKRGECWRQTSPLFVLPALSGPEGGKLRVFRGVGRSSYVDAGQTRFGGEDCGRGRFDGETATETEGEGETEVEERWKRVGRVVGRIGEGGRGKLSERGAELLRMLLEVG